VEAAGRRAAELAESARAALPEARGTVLAQLIGFMVDRRS
jgi:hypothetical protein